MFRVEKVGAFIGFDGRTNSDVDEISMLDDSQHGGRGTEQSRELGRELGRADISS
jgi:hypothetical protein